jgi:hypothetical protein
MIYPKLKGPALEAYRQMVSKLKQKAVQELGLPESEIIIRQLRPDDLGGKASLSTQDFNFGRASAGWDTIVNGQTIADNRFIGVNGFFFTGTHTGEATGCSQIKVTKMGAVTRYWNVGPVEFWEDKIGYFDDPVVVDQNTTVTVETWTRDSGSQFNWGLVGAVAEKRGLLINP